MVSRSPIWDRIHDVLRVEGPRNVADIVAITGLEPSQVLASLKNRRDNAIAKPFVRYAKDVNEWRLAPPADADGMPTVTPAADITHSTTISLADDPYVRVIELSAELTAAICDLAGTYEEFAGKAATLDKITQALNTS